MGGGNFDGQGGRTRGTVAEAVAAEGAASRVQIGSIAVVVAVVVLAGHIVKGFDMVGLASTGS